MGHRILVGDVRARLRQLEADSIHCVATSPPYWGLRDYKAVGQIGLEASPVAWVAQPLIERARRVAAVPAVVLDPFVGAGTTLLVADRLARDSIGIEINPDFADMAARRMAKEASLFAPKVEHAGR